jgi:methionine sulfoxide reductase catalytic subunit
MLIHRPDDCLPSEITPRSLFERRREFFKLSAGAALGAMLPAAFANTKLPGIRPGPYAATDSQTPYDKVTTYNNFYEFGTDKADPAETSGKFRTRPWKVSIEGLVKKPRTLDIDDILKLAPLEERIYRLRCVEAWSMVIPWVGFPLSTLLKQVEPLGSAKYVEFTSVVQKDTMPGVGGFASLDWPYTEGLRLDEAMHPLAIAAVGLYGEVLPNQNGAPLRVVLPWKYGFKSAKSIVTIRFVDKEPVSSWTKAAPSEYGFYSNVNPEVDHPRWTQSSERRIGEFLKRKTLMFNGYGDQVASLYAGMDLRKNY